MGEKWPRILPKVTTVFNILVTYLLTDDVQCVLVGYIRRNDKCVSFVTGDLSLFK
jgi:hypothetical protein